LALRRLAQLRRRRRPTRRDHVRAGHSRARPARAEVLVRPGLPVCSRRRGHARRDDRLRLREPPGHDPARRGPRDVYDPAGSGREPQAAAGVPRVRHPRRRHPVRAPLRPGLVMRVRVSLAMLLASTGLVAAACGGGGGGGGGSSSAGALPAGASVVPATAPVLVSADTDFSSDQWKEASALAKHFPGLPSLLTMLESQLQKQNVSLEQEVKPALGPEVDIAFLDLQNSGNNVVVLTKPDDKARLDALLAKGESPPATTEKDGWTVAADSKAKIDQFDQAGGSTLANDQEFQSVMKQLPADTLARVYVAGAPVQARLNSALSRSSAGQTGLTSGFGTFKGLGLAATAKDNGLRLDGVIDGTLSAAPASYKAELPSELPSGALLFVSFDQLDKQVRRVLDAVEKTQPNLKTQISQVEGVLGLTLENDVFPLLSREGAIAVYPSTAGLPTIEAVFRVPDETKAKSLVDRIGAIARLGGQTVQDVDVSGVAAHEID